MIEQTIEKLEKMRLRAMAENFARQCADPMSSELSFEERVGLMVDAQAADREDKRIQRFIKEAKFRHAAYPEEFRVGNRTGLRKPEFRSLCECAWITHKKNIVITGPTGTGKTWIACALGHTAIRRGFRAHFARLPLLFEALRVARVDGSFLNAMDKLRKFDVLILDDLGVGTLDAGSRNDLLEVVDAMSERSSIIVTSQLPTDLWHSFMAGENATVADSVLDRLLTGATRLQLGGASMRGE